MSIDILLDPRLLYTKELLPKDILEANSLVESVQHECCTSISLIPTDIPSEKDLSNFAHLCNSLAQN